VHAAVLPGAFGVGTIRAPEWAEPIRGAAMLDLVFALATLAFFAIGWAYAGACERL
jgi:hypothetical protein